MGQFDFTTGQTGVDIAAHKTRHEDTGADEISIKGLTGEPADGIVFFEDTIVSHEDKAVYHFA